MAALDTAGLMTFSGMCNKYLRFWFKLVQWFQRRFNYTSKLTVRAS